jgi:UDP-N-acetylmuramyl-tripeptide synthetase
VPVPWVVVGNARAAAGRIAAVVHGYPSRQVGLIGVTGTDGKTTVCHLIAHLLAGAGWPVGLLSTVEIRQGPTSRANDTHHTTPPGPVLQQILAEAVQQGVRWFVLEVSSHALAQFRVAGCLFDVGVFTNLTPEHLDFHGDFESYCAAKARLFTMLGRRPKPGVPTFAVLNADDPHHMHVSAHCSVTQVTYGEHPHADYRLEGASAAQRMCITHPHGTGGKFEVTPRIWGDFNRWNLAAAGAVALQLGVRPSAVAAAIEDFGGVPGRLQRVLGGQPFDVFVDFAHTPNGLRSVLTAVRSLRPNRVIVLLGHPGGRDQANRPDLARAAAELADVIVLTSDDPYDEEPGAILNQLEAPLREAAAVYGREVIRVDDRREAITRALHLAKPDDAVLLAGRGHLEHMTTRGQSVPFSDRAIARDELLRYSGPPRPVDGRSS